MPVFEKVSTFPCAAAELFAWHERPGAFMRLSPPWQDIRVIDKKGGIRNGDTLTLRVKTGPVPFHWQLRHEDYLEGRRFCDVQQQGPFAHWRHEHLFEDSGGEALLRDRIEYSLPAGLSWLAGEKIRKDIERAFLFRHERLRRDLLRHQKHITDRPFKIAVTGSSGLIGKALRAFLSTAGHEIICLVRLQKKLDGKTVYWKPSEGKLDPGALEGVDAVIHLAGENIASGRWSEKKKQRILNSRTEGTRLLAETLAALQSPPKVLISASAVGYYGGESAPVRDDSSAPGDNFLAKVCQAWEEAATPARDSGIRVFHPRIGVVLSPRGGALAKMLPVFKAGLGGVAGNGQQGFSWIDLDDLLGAFEHAMVKGDMKGAYNACSPQPVTNRELAGTLGRVLHRPAVVPVPAVAIRLLFGQMGEECLLEGPRAAPSGLTRSGFTFYESSLEGALKWQLGLFRTT